MDDSLHRRLLEIFDVEFRKNLETIRAALSRTEQSGNLSDADLHEIFRLTHGLKGAARAVGLDRIDDVSHRLESLFAELMAGRRTYAIDMSGHIHSVLDYLDDWLSAWKRRATPPDESTLETAFSELAVKTDESPAVSAGAFGVSAAADSPEAETFWMRTETLDRMVRSSERCLSGARRLSAVGDELAGLSRAARGVELALERLKSAHGTRDAGTGRDAREREYAAVELGLKELMRRLRAARLEHGRSSSLLSRAATEMADDVRRTRTVPADQIFSGLDRMVRDLARTENKKVGFIQAGMQIEADRRVLQKLREPVIHILRNAVGHGIETPRDRRDRNKPEAGKVGMAISSASGRLTLEITDDGRGIDVDEVRRAAERSGMDASGLEEDAMRLVFEPGVSTARQVTDLSGRGIGLASVETEIRRLHGRVSIQSEPGVGTCVRIDVPMILTTQLVVLVQCAGRTIGIPSGGIARLMRVPERDIRTVEGRRVVEHGGREIRLAELDRLLGLDRESSQPAGATPVVILKLDEEYLAVAVDDFSGCQECLVHELAGWIQTRGKLGGSAFLPDGRPIGVVDPIALLRARLDAVSGKPPAPAATDARRVPDILVVDDSFTTRTLEKTILEANGYSVRLAMDGVEALQALKLEPADLVIADVQMPRLDGFGLIAAMKQDSRLEKIPVIIVSSMESSDDRLCGLKLGAQAYIVKRKFDQKELLEAIGQLL